MKNTTGGFFFEFDHRCATLVVLALESHAWGCLNLITKSHAIISRKCRCFAQLRGIFWPYILSLLIYLDAFKELVKLLLVFLKSFSLSVNQSSISILKITHRSNEHLNVPLVMHLALIAFGIDADVVLAQDLLVLLEDSFAEFLITCFH